MDEPVPEFTELPVFFFVFREHDDQLKKLEAKIHCIQDQGERNVLRYNIQQARDDMYWACRADMMSFDDIVKQDMIKIEKDMKAMTDKYLV